MTLLQALVLGLVQGLTAFLPISSTAHLRIVPAVFGWHFYGGTTEDPGSTFTAILQLGTALAIVVFFWRELLHVSVAWVRGLYDRSMRGSLEYRLGWYLVLATIPVAVLGIVFRDDLERGARNLWLVASALVAVAFLLWAGELVGRRSRDEEELTRTDAVVVGVAEIVALVPGASRPGTMIAAGLFRGLTRVAAARFSFLLSVPAFVVFGVYGAVNIGSGHHRGPGAGLTGVALVVAFVVGLASLAWLMRWLANHGTFVFIYYRIALGVLVFVLLATGVLEATI